MKVWMCSDGSYSDWNPTAIYSDEETAKRMTEAYGWDNDPLEYEVDQDVPQEAREGLSSFCVLMWANGDVMHIERAQPAEDSWVTCARHFRDWGDPSKQEKQLAAYCWAKDEQHAVKIVNERRIIGLALNTGTDHQ